MFTMQALAYSEQECRFWQTIRSTREENSCQRGVFLVQWDVGLVPTPTLGKASSSAISVCLPEAGARLRGWQHSTKGGSIGAGTRFCFRQRHGKDEIATFDQLQLGPSFRSRNSRGGTEFSDAGMMNPATLFSMAIPRPDAAGRG